MISYPRWKIALVAIVVILGIFLAMPNIKLSSRAITVLGSTGRIRGYKLDGAKWVLV